MATIDAILLTTDLLGLAPPQHAANFIAALTGTELFAAWLEPLLPYLGDGRKEGKEVIPRPATQITDLLTGDHSCHPEAPRLAASLAFAHAFTFLCLSTDTCLSALGVRDSGMNWMDYVPALTAHDGRGGGAGNK